MPGDVRAGTGRPIKGRALPGTRSRSSIWRPRPGERIDWVAYAFVALFTIPFLLFNILPILFGIYLSFTKWGVFGAPKFIGLKNYYDAFHDEFVRIAFRNVLLYSL